MKTVAQASETLHINLEQGFLLHPLGFVRLQGNEVQVRCTLYKTYYCDRLKNL